jgi:hypothetical protein
MEIENFMYICISFKKKEMNKKLLTIPVIAFMALGMLAACGTKEINGEATAFGLVHAHSVGKAVVVVENSLVKSVVLDEMELPYSWAAVTRTNVGSDEKPTYAYKIQGVDIAEADFANQGNAFFARRIKIGDEVLTLKGASPVRGLYSNANIDGTYGIETWVRLDNNAKWYWEQMAAGRYEVLKEDGAIYNIDWTRTAPGANTKGDRWQKSANAYGANWVGLDTNKTPGRGWYDNIDAMAAYLSGKNPNNLAMQKMGATKAGNGKNTWEFDGTTGATLTDLSEYIGLAIFAFNKVK